MSVKFGAITRRSKFCCIRYLRYGSALVRGVLCLLSPCVPCTGVMWRVGVDRLSGQANCQEHYVGIGGLGCFRGVWLFLGRLWFRVQSVREGVHALGHRFWGRLGFRTIYSSVLELYMLGLLGLLGLYILLYCYAMYLLMI